MRKYIIYFNFLLIVIISVIQKTHAQKYKIDSLLELLKEDEEDTGKVNHLCQLCREYELIGGFREGLNYGEEALILTRKLNFKSGIANANNYIANIYYRQGNYHKALDFYMEALKIDEELKDKGGMSKRFGNIGNIYQIQDDYPKALEYYLKALRIAEEVGDKNKISIWIANIANLYFSFGDYPKALDYLAKALSMAEEQGDKNGQAYSLGNIGNVYYNQGNFPVALDYYFKALKIDEELENKNGIARHFTHIGNVYWDQGNYDKTLEYYFKTLKIDEEIEDQNGIAFILGGIGGVYKEQKNYSKALEYYLKALEISKIIEDKSGISFLLDGIGGIYDEQKDYAKALEYYFKALKCNEEIGNKIAIANLLCNIGSLYIEQKKYKESEDYLLKSLAIAMSIGSLVWIKEGHKNLSELYKIKGDKGNGLREENYKNAYEHYKQYSIAKDSLFNIEKNKDITRHEMNYEFEKKETATRAEQEKKNALSEAESRRQRLFLILAGAVAISVIIIAFIIFRSLRITRKQKEIIEFKNKETEQQKEIIQEKNKDITDSIHYAQRIQHALLAGDNLLKKNLPDFFVLYKPKDIVSGDFYWANAMDDKFILIIADCTGHGVPGAFMSLLNISFLNEATIEKKISSPDKILNHVRDQIVLSLNPEGSKIEGKDGMDCILCSFDFKNNILDFACANNPLWIVRDKEVIEYRADKMPVGMQLGERRDFNLQKIELKKGDTIYAFTDGYADQFGGPHGKKFKYKQLEEKLLEINNLSLENQKQILENTLNDWKGSLEQIDDILIIGVRI